MDSKDSDTSDRKHQSAGEPLTPPSDKDLKRAADLLDDFVSYVSSPWRIIWVNFVAGIFRGLGAVVGASIVIAFCIWLLSLFVSMPLIGKYFEEVRDNISGYVDQSNYDDEFDRLGDSLERIEGDLSEHKHDVLKQ